MTATESNRSHFRAVILTAIREEYQAVRKHLEDVCERVHPQGTLYEVGLFQSSGGNWDVFIAEVGKGNPWAAIEAERAIRFFEPHVALFVGVAGGVKDVSLGDVVAATKIYGYESGKADKVFEPRGEFGQATYRAAQRAKAIARKTDWLRRLKLEVSGNAPKALVEPMAAGEKVVAETRSETYKFIRANYGDALAVEMEGLGFLKATHANAGVDALVIRGISDLIDNKSESDTAGSQPIAADRASAFAFEVLATIYRGDTAVLPSVALALSELERESRARCSVRWQAAGLSPSESASLASDPNVGEPNKELKSEIGGGLTFLVGDLGIGKSLIIERLFQIAVNRVRMETGTPVPVYLEAKSVGGALQQTVESRALRIGDAKNKGVILFIDGLEEPGPERAHEIIDQTRLMIGLWPNSSAVISTRSMSMLNRVGSCRKIEPLNIGDALALVNRIGNTSYHSSTNYLPKSVLDAIRRPLFAILLGVFYRDHPTMRPTCKAALIQHLVDTSLKRIGTDTNLAELALASLAVLCIERGGAIPIADVKDYSTIDGLCDTGLLVRKNNTVEFGLPLFTEWFAARAIALGQIVSGDLLNDPNRLERWRYPLVIAIGTLSDDEVSGVLGPIVGTNPGFASVLIRDAISQWRVNRDASLPTLTDCGKQVRRAFQAFVDGIANLSELIAPVDAANKLRKTGVHIDQQRLTIAWSSQSVDEIEVVPLSGGFFGTKPEQRQEWREVRGGTPADESAWPWEWALSHLSWRLNEILDKRQIPMEHGPLYSERLWFEASQVTGRSENSIVAIDLSDIEKKIVEYDEIVKWARQMHAGDSRVTEVQVATPRNVDIEFLRASVARLKGEGESSVRHPLPPPDISTGFTLFWEAFSREQLLNRVRTAYELSIVAYEQIVNRWFARFRGRLNLSVILPARLHLLIEDYGGAKYHGPVLHKWLEPLPSSEKTEVVVEWLNNVNAEDTIQDEWSKLKSLRPNDCDWLHLTYSQSISWEVLRWNGISETVYGWLKDDLKQIQWLN